AKCHFFRTGEIEIIARAVGGRPGNWEDWRTLGEEIRKHTIENLDYYLEQMNNHVIERGGHVFFANTAEEATEYIKEVAKKLHGKKNCQIKVDGDRRN